MSGTFEQGPGVSLEFNQFMPKSRHNGRDIISVTMPYPDKAEISKQNPDASQFELERLYALAIADYKAGVGEPDPDGVGCWVKRGGV